MRLTVLQTALLCALSVPVVAAESEKAKDASDDAEQLETVQVTATRRPEATLDVPAATTVVGARRLREQHAQTAMDLLHGETGTFVQQTTPGQAVVIVRGLKGSEVLHLVDGFRLNTAFFRNSPNQYMALVDGQLLDRIEVVRGPSSTLYGGGAMGGVVQLFSREPQFDGSDWQWRGAVRGAYATADESSLSRIEGAAGHDRIAVSAGLSYQDVGDLETGSRELPFTAFTSRGADAKVRIEPWDGHEFMLSGQYYEQPSTPRVDELIPGFGQTQSTSVEFAFEPQARRFTHARYRGSNPTALWDNVEVHLGHQTIVDDRRTRERGTPNREIEANSSNMDGITAQAGKALGISHYLTYGFEYYDDEIRSERRRLNVDNNRVTARPPRFPDKSTMQQLGVFVADDWKLGAVDLNTGVRYSSIETELPSLNGFAVNVDDDDVSGHLGVSYAVSEQTRVVGNVGRAFRPPNVFDLGTFGDRPSNRFNIPNPDLKPETVTSFDVGMKYGDGRWNAEAFAFRSRYRDKITSVLTGETTSSGRLVVQSRNATKLDIWGLEAGIRGQVRDDVEVYGTMTYTRGDEEFAGDEYAADRIPPIYGKVGAIWRGAPWTLEGYVFYATGQDRLSPRDEIDPRINPDGTAGWVTLNARAAYRVTDDLDLSLRLENLTDRTYREHGTGLDEPGFNAMIGFDWRF